MTTLCEHRYAPWTGGALTVEGVGAVRDVVVSPDGRHAYAAASRRVTGAVMWTIDVVDTSTNRVIAVVANLPDVIPTSMAVSPDSSRLYVADRDTACIHAVDVDSASATRYRVLHALSLDGSSPVEYGAPSALAVSPDGARLYALVNESGVSPALLIIDPHARVVHGSVPGGDSMAIYAADEHIYVCTDDRHRHTNLSAGVKILAADTGRVLGVIGFHDAPAFIRQPILAAGHGLLYLDIDDLDGQLEVIDTTLFDLSVRIRIDTSLDGDLRNIPVAAALSPDGRYLYVANQGMRLSSDEATEVGWVSVVDTETHCVISDIALKQPGIDESHCSTPQFIAISPGGDRLVVVTQNGIAAVIDTESKTVVDTVTLGHPPQSVTVNTLGNTVYIGTAGEAGLTVIRL